MSGPGQINPDTHNLGRSQLSIECKSPIFTAFTRYYLIWPVLAWLHCLSAPNCALSARPNENKRTAQYTDSRWQSEPLDR